MSFFYDHLILIGYLHQEVESMLIEDEDKQELINIIEETVHHYILHRILDKLHEKSHEEFLVKFHQTPHDRELLAFLKANVPDIEHHIKEAAEEIKYELLKTIRES